MSYSTKQRLDYYKKSSAPVQELYSSPETGELLRSTANMARLSSELYGSFALLIGDFILGFFPISELNVRLQNELKINSSQAQQIMYGLTGLIAEIEKNHSKDAGSLSNPDILPMPRKMMPEQPATPANYNQPIESAEHLSALRTMQGDAERIHGYGAYRRRNEPSSNQPQSSTQPLAAPPRYVDTDGEQQ